MIPVRAKTSLMCFVFIIKLKAIRYTKKVEERYQVDGTSGIASKQYQPSRFPGHFMFAPKRK